MSNNWGSSRAVARGKAHTSSILIKHTITLYSFEHPAGAQPSINNPLIVQSSRTSHLFIQYQIVLDCFIRQQIIVESFYSAMNHSRNVVRFI